jgi:hypothetical protein
MREASLPLSMTSKEFADCDTVSTPARMEEFARTGETVGTTGSDLDELLRGIVNSRIFASVSRGSEYRNSGMLELWNNELASN